MPKRKSHNSQKTPFGVSLLVFFAIAIYLFFQNVETPPPSSPASHLLAFSPPAQLEIPAPLPARQEQIITHTGYTVSYNTDLKIPNWVAYVLTGDKLEGDEPRYNTFKPDPFVPFEFSATNDDYKNTGWDRGHMAPAADMKWDKQAMIESFYFSNICPQNRNLNAGMWKILEEQVRALAAQKGILYIICGPIVSESPQTIGANKVAVPCAFFKCLLQWDNGEYHTIAFVMANESGKKPLSTYATTVDEVQTITGINFFHTLPDTIQSVIENRVDFEKWNITASR